MLEGRRIILGVSGGIAAYKAIEVCRRLVDAGAHVVPVLTEAAHNMVGPTTFTALASEPVKTSLWADRDPIPHTRMGQSADAIVVCPATARVISDLATGRSGDLLAATLIATAAPVVVCPAMHTEMWEHPAVEDNIATLRRRGVVIVPPEEGRLAGGDLGKGRLAEPETVVAAVQNLFADDGAVRTDKLLSGRHVLVTAGGTREDPMSGYFAVSQEYYQRTVARVNPRGFKILLEFVARGDKPTVTEVAYEFRSRVRGSTKLTGSVLASYLLAIIELTAGRFISATFTAYALVGLTGLCLRLASSHFLMSVMALNLAALLAIELSVVWNYVFNNGLTFSSKRHVTTAESIRGLVLFHIVSAQGLLVQAGVTSYLATTSPGGPVWSTAVGWVPLTVGIAAATVGNYFLNSHLTWPGRSRFSER